MRKNAKYLIFLSLFSLFYMGCDKEDNLINVNTDEFKSEYPGELLNNPYSITNMRKALSQLKSDNKIEMATPHVTPSHLYVRFKPITFTQMEVLQRDTTLELFTYPLTEMVIKEDTTEVQNANASVHNPEWLYTVVPVNYVFPSVSYQILDSCYIPDDDDIEPTSLKSNEFDNLGDLLEYESFRLTGNLSEEDSLNNDLKTLKASARVKPDGFIRFTNTHKGLEGAMHVKVRVHNFVKIKSTHTDDNGHYHINKKFKTNVHYGLIFENEKGFKIWGNWGFVMPAHYNMGWHSPNGHSREFHQNSIAWKWCTVNNAVYKYYNYCNTFSIAKPPSNLRVWVFEKNNGQSAGSASMMRRTYGTVGFTTQSQIANFYLKHLGISISANYMAAHTKFAQPDITIAVNSDNVDSPEVYNTVFHECAHASHWTKVGSPYWIKYINYIITYGAYGNGSGANAGYCGVGEMWGNYIGALFERQEFIAFIPYRNTPLNDNWSWFEEDESWFNPGFLKDVNFNTSDITTAKIFECMKSTTITISKMKTELKTKTSNGSQIDILYNNILYSDWK